MQNNMYYRTYSGAITKREPALTQDSGYYIFYGLNIIKAKFYFEA